jgi:hypothetical protein
LALEAWASDTRREELGGRDQGPARRAASSIHESLSSTDASSALGATATPADITFVWTKLRGPGAVAVTPPRVAVHTGGDGSTVVEASATATFLAPGEYVLRAEPVEIDDGFDGLCCFTFANVRVIVK